MKPFKPKEVLVKRYVTVGNYAAGSSRPLRVMKAAVAAAAALVLPDCSFFCYRKHNQSGSFIK